VVVGEVARPVDVLVIGGGPGGYTAAARAAELGREVVLVERDRLGGVCLNVGCIPSKALITAAHEVSRNRFRPVWLGESDAAPRPGPVGRSGGTGTVDFGQVRAWQDEVVTRLVNGVRQHLARVEVVAGEARFLDSRRVAVESGDQVSHFRFDHAIIATGTRPITLPGLPVDGVRVLDSTGALALTEVPASLAVVGGGYIGLELGSAYATLGAKVSIVEATGRLLGGFDPDLVAEVERGLAERGVRVLRDAKADGVEGDGLRVVDRTGARVLPAERILVAVGRRPNTDDLQLAEAGLTTTPDGRIPVDAQRRTAVPHIFAIGDVTDGPALAHKAYEEGRVAAEVIAGRPSAFDQVVPLIAFTDPELASVGLTQAEAKEQGLDVVVGKASFATSGRALTLDEPRGLVKVVVEAESGVVRGVQIAGPGASDLIGAGAFAVETASRAEDLARTVLPHPTLVESLGGAARAAERRRDRRRPR
jgi:dihydrolipoamide dehydrogenase